MKNVIPLTALGLLSIACGRPGANVVDDVVFVALPDEAPALDSDSVELGRLLFWDPVLSGDNNIACGTCHLPENAYTDGRGRSIGTAGQPSEVPRNAPTVLNTAWNGMDEFGNVDAASAPMFWDNRANTLEAQAVQPILADVEMRGRNFSEDEIEAEVLRRLNAIPNYQERFAAAYGSSVITMDDVTKAIADFERSLVANNSPYDQYIRGDDDALSAQQINGMEAFARNGCADCHSGPMFSDFETHVLGVQEADGLDTPDRGDGDFAFRTPSLRQLEFTAPYFHGGQEETLRDVIEFYDRNDRSNNDNVARNELDNDFRDIGRLGGGDERDIEAFLNALNDDGFDKEVPESVPSGLPVGGSMLQ